MALEKIHPVDKEHYCETVYSEYLVHSAELLNEYEERAGIVEVILPCGCYTNFRDALFHFRKLISSSEEKEIECQAFAMKEHLSRALTDAASSVLDHASFAAEKLVGDDRIDSDLVCRLRSKLHEMKQVVLRKRFEGMMFSSKETKITHEEILKLIDSFYDLVGDNCKDEFGEYSWHYSLYNDHIDEQFVK